MNQIPNMIMKTIKHTLQIKFTEEPNKLLNMTFVTEFVIWFLFEIISCTQLYYKQNYTIYFHHKP